MANDNNTPAQKKSLLSRFKHWAVNDPKISIPTFIALGCVVALGIYAAITYAPKSAVVEVPREDILATIETLNANQVIDGLISESTTFKLTTNVDTTSTALEQSIVLSPEMPYKIKAVTGSEYELILTAPLPKGSLLSIAYQSTAGPTSKAFQIAGRLKLDSVYPKNSAMEVPLNTGIELKFSEAIDESILNYISIEPKLELETRIDANTLILTSKTELTKDTMYSLTLKSGYKSALGSEITEDFTSNFFTGTQSTYDTRTYGEMALFQDNEPLNLTISSYTPAEFYDVSVYPIENVESLLEQTKQYDAMSKIYIHPEKHLTSSNTKAIYSEKLAPIISGNFSSKHFIELPQLPAGIYRVDCLSDKVSQVSFIQVTPYAVYFEYNKKLTQNLFWLLNAKTSEPAKATYHSVNSTNQVLAESDKDGVAKFSLDADTTDIIITTEQSRILIPSNGFSSIGNYYGTYGTYDYWWRTNDTVVPKEFENNPKLETPMKFLYTDREYYLPGESVSLFGLLKTNQYKDLEYVYVRVEDSDPIRIPVNAYGAFTAEFSAEIIGNSYGGRRIQIGSEYGLLASHYIYLEYFEKPEVIITNNPLRNYYGPGETIEISGEVKHVDGTPMKSYSLSIDDYKDFNTKTDEFGRFLQKITPTFNPEAPREYYEAPTSFPKSYWINVSSTETETVPVSTSSTCTVFPSSIILDANAKSNSNDENVVIDITAHDLKMPVQTDNIEDYSSSNWGYKKETFIGKGLNLTCEYTLEETYLESKVTGKQYDSFFKVEVPTYEYNQVTQMIDSGLIDIVNGNGEFSFKPVVGRDYKLVVKAKDHSGIWQYALARYNTQRMPETSPVVLEENVNDPLLEAKKHILTSSDYLPSMPSSIEFEPNVPFSVPLSIPDPLKAITDENKAKTLFIRYAHNYLKHEMQSGLAPIYTDQVTEEELPSGMVKALFYDGFRFQNSVYSKETLLKLSPKSKTLDVIIKTDSDHYSPGSTITASIQLLSNGKPVKGGVWLNVVDEAYYEVYQEYSDAYTAFYAPHYETGVTKSFNTSDAPVNYMAESGDGGGSGYLRDDFKNTAYAKYLLTDEKGVANFTFVLPDNITTWRLTSHASAANGHIGTARIKIPSTLPFYLRYLTTNNFTVKDEPIVLVSSRAINQLNLNESTEINYAWSLDSGNNVIHTGTSVAPLSSKGEIPLGVLKVGDYQLTIKGHSPEPNANKDAVKLPISVVNSFVHFNASTQHIVEKDGSWESTLSSQPAHITLWHKEAKDTRTALANLSYGDPRRLEYYLSSILVNNYLNSSNEKVHIPLDAIEPFSEGLYKPLINAETSAELTADVVALLPEFHANQSLLQSHLMYTSNSTEDLNEFVTTLRIKATLKQPVLFELHQLSKKQLTASQRLELAWAFVAIGDLEMAKVQWVQLSEALALTANDPVRVQYLRAIVSQALNLEDTAKYYEQAVEATPDYHNYQLLQLYYLLHQSTEIQPTTLQIEFLDASNKSLETKAVTLSDAKGFYLEVPANQLVKVRNVSDTIEVAYHYEGNLNNTNFDLQGYGLKRTYNKTKVGIGDFIEVEVTVTRPNATSIQLIETIPPGFNVVGNQLLQKNRQLVFYSSGNGTVQTFKYVLKPRMAGKFTCEPSILAGYSDNTSLLPGYLKGVEVSLEVTQ